MRNFIFKYFEIYPIKTRIVLLAVFIGLMTIGANVDSHSAKLSCFLPAVVAGFLSHLNNDDIKFLLRIK
jgi:hypothetical protein